MFFHLIKEENGEWRKAGEILTVLKSAFVMAAVLMTLHGCNFLNNGRSMWENIPAVANLGLVVSLMRRRILKMRQHSINYSRVVITPTKAPSVWLSFRGLQLILPLTGMKRVMPSGWRRLPSLLLIRRKIEQNVARDDNHWMHFLISASLLLIPIQESTTKVLWILLTFSFHFAYLFFSLHG